MIKLGSKAALLFILIAILDVVIGGVFSSLIRSGKIDTLSDIEYVVLEKPDILIVGASSAEVGYDSELISKLTGLKTINIAIGGVSSAYVYIVTKEIISKFKPSYIVYDNLEADILGLFQSDNSASRLAYLYGQDSEIDSIISEVVPWSSITLRSNIYKYRKIIKNLLQFSQTVPGDNYLYVEPDDGVRLNYDIAKKKRLLNPHAKSVIIQPNESSLSYRCFGKLMDLCEKAGVSLIVVRSPRYPYIETTYDTKAIQIAKLRMNNSNTVFKHISLKEYPYFREKKFYKDIVHVNALGADSISTIVSNIILEMENKK